MNYADLLKDIHDSMSPLELGDYVRVFDEGTKRYYEVYNDSGELTINTKEPDGVG